MDVITNQHKINKESEGLQKLLFCVVNINDELIKPWFKRKLRG